MKNSDKKTSIIKGKESEKTYSYFEDSFPSDAESGYNLTDSDDFSSYFELLDSKNISLQIKTSGEFENDSNLDNSSSVSSCFKKDTSSDSILDQEKEILLDRIKAVDNIQLAKKFFLEIFENSNVSDYTYPIIYTIFNDKKLLKNFNRVFDFVSISFLYRLMNIIMNKIPLILDEIKKGNINPKKSSELIFLNYFADNQKSIYKNVFIRYCKDKKISKKINCTDTIISEVINNQFLSSSLKSASVSSYIEENTHRKKFKKIKNLIKMFEAINNSKDIDGIINVSENTAIIEDVLSCLDTNIKISLINNKKFPEIYKEMIKESSKTNEPFICDFDGIFI